MSQKLDYTYRFVQQAVVTRDAGIRRNQNTASLECDLHDKGKDGSKTQREPLIQNITKLSKLFPRIRELIKSSQPDGQNVAARVAISQWHAVTNNQPIVHGWAESGQKYHVSR